MTDGAATEHYFTASPAGPEEQRSVEITLAGRRVTVRTARGVFSPDHVDGGTAVLLREAPDPPAEGTFLDLGCGWGPVALALGLHSPAATVWAVDVNERSLGLTATNAASLDLLGIRTGTPEAVPADVRFDLIWSNPPIRVGKAALHAMLVHWLPRLAPGGAAYLVVQKNLGSDSLQRWLTDQLGPQGYAVARHASDKGFRVLEVLAPPAE